MPIGIMIFVTLLVCVFGLLARNKTEHVTSETADEEDILKNDTADKYHEMEELFFSEVSNGKERYEFLKIYNQFDLMFIKSLFQSEAIPYYTKFEHVSHIRPGMFIGDLGNYNILYILDEDYNDAVEIVEHYVKTKQKDGEENAASDLRNVAEILLANWKVPSANDTGGIHIMYKNKEK